MRSDSTGVVILAGGLGTRLRSALPASTPKPLALVGGKPFLAWIIRNLGNQGITSITLSVGWMADRIMDVIGAQCEGVGVRYCVERSPLGTGGAIARASEVTTGDRLLVLNGDTYTDASIEGFVSSLRSEDEIAIACTRVQDTSRYGRVEIVDDVITEFVEKGVAGPGPINAGLYCIARSLLNRLPLTAFSFESDLLKPEVRKLRPRAYLFSGVFVDIGVPDDLTLARDLFADHAS